MEMVLRLEVFTALVAPCSVVGPPHYTVQQPRKLRILMVMTFAIELAIVVYISYIKSFPFWVMSITN